MAAIAKRERFEMPEPVRRFFEGDWDTPTMRVEEFRDGNSLVIKAEMPGIDPEKDVDISVSEGVLHIQAQREEKSEYKGKDGYRSEFRYGSFLRDIALPRGCKEEEVTASYRDGMLEVRVPVPEQAESSKKVPVIRS
ncbi:Hsp20/alpha crystallin family protein [Cryobacterium sp. TMT1-21]|uniref:Hsp20/alpha crystallin family protein n=1 Tax=Cryobacterium shii TaxID=1259235 RepID=A0AAQ2C4R6_9MICO|nr:MULTISPECIES: Hsp20/alpha crystallin family protein [Cryobacterium]TFC43147.1 Hsp20/alpha crystallin family protein [Cryobacterium shii]TFC86210.1 Hsp20/alpha crystallin family protein [Cryobacterium sp. TmT2-59]TFD12652.1 Hsp20/alpha crystallin family protein [Cryobacterium sp. TMT1-21]TFD17379.1 Hsp20/alpha crystallin family protein [Cryobacterium sp. TMT4-10]TFD20792.1 Hsp20/alpha crystallin family protein [Cryobacterium sp. TMT2-23]